MRRVVVADEHLVGELEPDEGDGEGLQGVGLYPLLAQVGGEEIAGREARQHEDEDEEDDIPARALPGGGGVPDDDADEADDIAARLATGGEEYHEHHDGGQQRAAEGDMTVLYDAQVGQQEEQGAGHEEPQVAELQTGGAVDEAQQRDVLREGREVLGVLLREADVPLVVLVDDVLGTGDGHGQHEHDDGPEEQ